MLMLIAACLVVPLLLMCWSGPGPLRRSPWPGLAAAATYGLGLARAAWGNVKTPHEWDYACFWLYGHVAAARANVYDPAAFAHLPAPFTFSDEFRRAVLDVGFPYPPPTIALFYPLGFISSVPAGLALWYGVQFAALAGAAWVLGRALWPEQSWRGPALVLGIAAALPASLMNVGDAQTNFIALLLVALAFASLGTPRGAVWSALVIWVKPYAAALLIADLAQRNWRRLAAAAAVLAASLAASIVLVGPAAFATYLRSNPAGREPAFAFVEVVNQSLLAVVLRLGGTLPDHVSALHEPLYLVAAALLAIATLALCARPNVPVDAAFAASLLLGLIVYPGALSSYGVVLLVPLLVLWRHRAAFPGGAATIAGLIGLAVLLQSAPVERGLAANAIVWAACAYVLVARRAPHADRAPVAHHIAAGVAR